MALSSRDRQICSSNNKSHIDAWMRSFARSSTAACSGRQLLVGSLQKLMMRSRLRPQAAAVTQILSSRRHSFGFMSWTSLGSRRRSYSPQVVLHPVRKFELLLMKLITKLIVLRFVQARMASVWEWPSSRRLQPGSDHMLHTRLSTQQARLHPPPPAQTASARLCRWTTSTFPLSRRHLLHRCSHRLPCQA